MKVKLEILGAMGKRETQEIEVGNYYEASIAADAIAVNQRKAVVISHANDEEDKKGFLKRLLGG